MGVPVFRVSHLSSFARWREDEDSDVDWLIDSIMNDKPNARMLKGTAFHKYLETAQEGNFNEFTVDGFRFVFTVDVEISLPKYREVRRYKDYGGIIVTGCADVSGGLAICDYKTTERFEADNYLEGWQWRFYLDLFEADKFTWTVWEMKEIEPSVYEVYGFHELSQYRYPDMDKECRQLAQDFKLLADRYLKGYSFVPDPPKNPTRPASDAQDSTQKDQKTVQSPLISGEIKEWKMIATKGVNLIGVGWCGGYMRVVFADDKKGRRFGIHEGVPEAEAAKLVRSPYPDKLYSTIIKGKKNQDGSAMYPYYREAVYSSRP